MMAVTRKLAVRKYKIEIEEDKIKSYKIVPQLYSTLRKDLVLCQANKNKSKAIELMVGQMVFLNSLQKITYHN